MADRNGRLHEEAEKRRFPLHKGQDESSCQDDQMHATSNTSSSTSSRIPSILVSLTPILVGILVSYYALHHAEDFAVPDPVALEEEELPNPSHNSWKFWKSKRLLDEPQVLVVIMDERSMPFNGENSFWNAQNDNGVLRLAACVSLLTAIAFLHYILLGDSREFKWNNSASPSSITSEEITPTRSNSKAARHHLIDVGGEQSQQQRRPLIRARSTLRFSQWARELTQIDPRVQILNFFNQVAARGASEQLIDQCQIHVTGVCTNHCLQQIKFNQKNKQHQKQLQAQKPKKRGFRAKLKRNRSFPFATSTHFHRQDSSESNNKYNNQQLLNRIDDSDRERMTSKEFSLLSSCFNRSSVFTVWRPTSQEAIRKMMHGGAVGKGLDIKGKSAVRGKLSAFVPVVQIYLDRHKRMLRLIPKDARMRLYFSTAAARRVAQVQLIQVSQEMQQEFDRARTLVKQQEADLHRAENLHLNGATPPSPASTSVEDDEQWEEALEHYYKWGMVHSQINLIDDHISARRYGLELPQRLFVEAYIIRGEIHREPGSDLDTGRPSQPAFLDMNLESLRKHFSYDKEHDEEHGSHHRDHHKSKTHKWHRSKQHRHSSTQARPPAPPKPVAFQYAADPDRAMDPRELVMAYEENGRVLPVVSDFDCFLVGTRRVEYTKPVPQEQVDMMKWCVDQIEQVLDGKAISAEDASSMQMGSVPSTSWTKQWLEVLKKERLENNFKPNIPKFGYADPKSYAIMAHAIEHLESNGCVRHGAECFNYYFPQELDKEFLVISNDANNDNKSRWAKYTQEELLGYLSRKIDEGFMFPLNPKWILCDAGWKRLYDKQMRSPSPSVKQSLLAWYPPTSGIRERLEAVHAKYPHGFIQQPAPKFGGRMSMANGAALGGEENISMAMALMEVDRVDKLRKAKKVFRAVIAANRLAKGSRAKGGLFGLSPVVNVKTSSLAKGTLYRGRSHQDVTSTAPQSPPTSPTKSRPSRSKSSTLECLQQSNNSETLSPEPRKSMPPRSHSLSLTKTTNASITPLSLPPLPPTAREPDPSRKPWPKQAAAMIRIDRRQLSHSSSPSPSPAHQRRRGSGDSKGLLASLQSTTTKRHSASDPKGPGGK